MTELAALLLLLSAAIVVLLAIAGSQLATAIELARRTLAADLRLARNELLEAAAQHAHDAAAALEQVGADASELHASVELVHVEAGATIAGLHWRVDELRRALAPAGPIKVEYVTTERKAS